jgi:hypothetical protein
MIEIGDISTVRCDVEGCAGSIRIYTSRAIRDPGWVRRTACVAHGWGSIPVLGGREDLCPEHAEKLAEIL